MPLPDPAPDPTRPPDPSITPAALDAAEPLIDLRSVAGLRNVNAGAQRIGSADYAVPVGAVFVAPQGSDATGNGSAIAPYATIQKAIDKAASGATLVLRAGTYHEKITITKKLTIQPYPKEAVWLDGSVPITGWVQSGALWVASGWNHVFDHSPTFTQGAADCADAPGTDTNGWCFVNPAYPMAAYPDQMWIDGVAQTQVASKALVQPGAFFYDEAASKLYLGSDPTGHVVRASDLQQAVIVTSANATGTVLQGFGVRRFAPSNPQMGAMYIGSPGFTARNMLISDHATIGMHLSAATDALIENVTVARNGMLGLSGNGIDRSVITGLLATGNNSEHFNFAPVSGGFKTGRVRGITVQDSVFLNNPAPGLWFDESSYDMKVLGNDFIGNAGNGLTLEISAKALVANNLAATNGGSGIRVDGTSYVDLWNNTLVKNSGTTGGRNLNITMGTRRWATYPSAGARDARNAPLPEMTWISRPVTMRNNVVAGGAGNCLLCVEDYSHEFSAAQLQISSEGNVYQRPATNAPTWAVVWSRGPGDPAVFNTLALFRAAVPGQETRSQLLEGSAAVDASYKITPTVSAAVNMVAEPLPASIATWLGKPAGSRQLGAWW